MKLKQNYIKCFDSEKSKELEENGFEFLYEQNGVYYHKNNDSLIAKFNKTDILSHIKFSNYITM